MIQERTLLSVADNSGAKCVMCIKVLGGSGRRYASISDIIVIVIKESIFRGKVKNGDVLRAVVVRTKKSIVRSDGFVIKFDSNACVLLQDKSKQPIGTRIFGSVTKELKYKNFVKILSLASEVL